MKSKIFEEVDIKGKIIILSLIQEMKRTVSFRFCNETHVHFTENYPKFYKRGETSFLTGYEGKIDFVSGISNISKKDETITLFKKEYFSPDGNLNACYRRFVCASYPKGVEVIVPIRYLNELHIF